MTFLNQPDKRLHILVSYAMTLTLALVMPLLWAAPIALFVGFAKERFYDWYRPTMHTAEWADVAADAIGVAVAVACLLLAPLVPKH